MAGAITQTGMRALYPFNRPFNSGTSSSLSNNTTYCKNENPTHHYENRLVWLAKFMKSCHFLGSVDVAQDTNHLHQQVAPTSKGSDGSQLCHGVEHVGRIYALKPHLCAF